MSRTRLTIAIAGTLLALAGPAAAGGVCDGRGSPKHRHVCEARQSAQPAAVTLHLASVAARGVGVCSGKGSPKHRSRCRAQGATRGGAVATAPVQVVAPSRSVGVCSGKGSPKHRSLCASRHADLPLGARTRRAS